MKKVIQKASVFLLLFISNFHSSVFAQGTAFTYQGVLSIGGSPATGSYDFSFALFNNNGTNTGQVGGTLTNPGVMVTNGIFTTTLDFGSVFTGNSLWLAINVRSNGGGNFTPLLPLQALTPVPSAIYANTSSNGSGIWSLNNTNAYFSGGKVGIGTNAPNHRLTISGGPGWTANGWKGAIDLENAAAIGWQGDAAGQKFGIGQTGGGVYIFHTTSSPGTTSGAANYDLEINDGGYVSILHPLSVTGDTTLTGNLFASTSDTYTLGGNSILTGGAWSAVYSYNFINPSDARLKTDIKPLAYGITELLRLRPVSYTWKDKRDTRTHLGLIAQEVQHVIPEAVYGSADTNSWMGITYSDLIPMVIKAVQEQQITIDHHDADLNSLKAENASLKAQNAALETRLEAIEQILKSGGVTKTAAIGGATAN